MQVWNQAAKFDPARSSPDVWVLMIARSRAVDRLRKRQHAASTKLTDLIPIEDTGSGELERQEDAGRVHAALGHLPPEQREPIFLAFFHGLTHDQIARQLTIPLGTVKTRIRLGMNRLRERFSDPLSLGNHT
ncbi:RNA polymerase sigma-70 factor [Fimbriiglobus ruber]|uniref:RNA polymerase sigma-70 factor n=1 Tax=Fimbriiglobus ruber TaxID=1908690 RepID=A0A225DUH2_9BACT|nr:RNA polymerase sigma-70 factor [Fimbriiglobus ruber]